MYATLMLSLLQVLYVGLILFRITEEEKQMKTIKFVEKVGNEIKEILCMLSTGYALTWNDQI